MPGWLHRSCAWTLAELRLHTGTEAGLQPRFWSAGKVVKTGGVMSLVQKICWTHVAVLPPQSVAVKVSVRTFEQPSAEVKLDCTQVITGVPQLSVGATRFGLCASVQSGMLDGLQDRNRLFGHLVKVGGVV